MPESLGLDGTAVLAVSSLVLLLAALVRYRTTHKSRIGALSAALASETARRTALARVTTRALEYASMFDMPPTSRPPMALG